MIRKPLGAMERREFLKLAGATTVVGMARRASAEAAGRVAVILDGANPIALSGPVKWAAGQFAKALEAKGVKCEVAPTLDRAAGSAFCVVIAGASSAMAREVAPPAAEVAVAEGFRLTPAHVAEMPATLVSAIDQRGFVYGLLELAERAQFGAEPVAELRVVEALEERPSNEVRSVGRYFCGEIEDLPWYRDKEFWPGYLDVLAASRFNRFCLGFGLEYDFPRGVTDDYLHLPYPYLVEVPGFRDVKVMRLRTPEGEKLTQPVALSASERERNLEMLKFIAAETGARGLHFQLGLWTHAYEWTDSPNAYHRIDGLTAESHARYCREALAMILKECPEIQGLTMRVHGESGIPEGSWDFWKTLFEAIAGCGRKIEIDMHAKGVNQTMIDIALATGMPVKLGAKYSAEHQSLGYEQADIRALEIPKAGGQQSSLFSLSSGSRSFTRYGYADFLAEGSKAKLVFRLWPGTQRHLLSADPEMAAAYGRTSHLCGATGMDLMEPLTFKGREGTGAKGGRCAYADESLNPKADWKKFETYYRVWGRKLYDPDAPAEAWRRHLRADFGAGAVDIEAALGNASRVLPLLTSAHLPSASNHSLWYEMYTNMPIVPGSEKPPYSDTPEPKCFGTVSPLDPQLFSTIAEHALDLLAATANAKYSPIEVAQWLEHFVTASRVALEAARVRARDVSSAEFRRVEADVLIQIGIGEFFAAKLRSGVLYEIYQQTGSEGAGKLAVTEYQKARESWAKMAERAKGVYRSDVTYGDIAMRRGHWSDRMAAIDADLKAMEAKVQAAEPAEGAGAPERIAQAVHAATVRPIRPAIACTHTPPESFSQGKPLELSLTVDLTNNVAPTDVRLHYRHVNQGERWLAAEMRKDGGGFRAAIPGDYTKSAFALQYYFELRRESEAAWLFPAFNATLSNQPYYAIAKKSV